jgi:hypothetical protein
MRGAGRREKSKDGYITYKAFPLNFKYIFSIVLMNISRERTEGGFLQEIRFHTSYKEGNGFVITKSIYKSLLNRSKKVIFLF